MDAITTQTILLVEDDENDVAFVTRALKKAGIANGLKVAEDGQQAIDYISGKGEFADRTRYPMPALVLLDLKLPRVLGMDVLKWIRQQPELHLMLIIVLTSSQQRTDVSQACALGANSYLVKPSDPFDLTEMMELVKRYWLRLNQPTASIGVAASSK
jgi:DNA-binding response OmpR family regulator